MIVTAIGLLVVVVLSIYIAWPLLAGAAEEPVAVPEPNSLEREKEAALSAIGELDFDHRVGKISDQDHKELRAELETRALRALAALDGKTPHPENAETPDASAKRLDANFCPSCGHTLIESPNYCASCGENLSPSQAG